MVSHILAHISLYIEHRRRRGRGLAAVVSEQGTYRHSTVWGQWCSLPDTSFFPNFNFSSLLFLVPFISTDYSVQALKKICYHNLKSSIFYKRNSAYKMFFNEVRRAYAYKSTRYTISKTRIGRIFFSKLSVKHYVWKKVFQGVNRAWNRFILLDFSFAFTFTKILHSISITFYSIYLNNIFTHSLILII